MTFRKLLILTAWLTWIIIWSSASSWKHLREPWLDKCPPWLDRCLTYYVILSGIAPPKYTGFSPEYVSHNQVMNTFWSCILLLEEPQNFSSSTGRFCLTLLIFDPQLKVSYHAYFFLVIWCLFPNTHQIQCQFCRHYLKYSWKWTISTSKNPRKFSISVSLWVTCDNKP